MLDILRTKVPCPWLTLPSARELHNEISAITVRRNKQKAQEQRGREEIENEDDSCIV